MVYATSLVHKAMHVIHCAAWIKWHLFCRAFVLRVPSAQSPRQPDYSIQCTQEVESVLAGALHLD
jgi:hypothetical protein